MGSVNNCYYINNNSFVNSFDLADYIIINYPSPLYLTRLLSLLYFYQIGAIIFNKTIPFEDEIKVKNEFLYIEDISTKYKKYKRRDLTKTTMIKLPCTFAKNSTREKFLIQLMNYCAAIKEDDLINIVVESPLFKRANLTVKKIISFKAKSRSSKAIKEFKEENSFLPIFVS